MDSRPLAAGPGPGADRVMDGQSRVMANNELHLSFGARNDTDIGYPSCVGLWWKRRSFSRKDEHVRKSVYTKLDCCEFYAVKYERD